jgi:hypothetical protein
MYLDKKVMNIKVEYTKILSTLFMKGQLTTYDLQLTTNR